MPGFDLASGRFRDGGWSGMGPALFAVRSKDIQEAQMDELIESVPLIFYDADFDNENAAKLNGYSEADNFSGGAWVNTPAGDAVIFVGTHGYGKNWYGFANGVIWSTLDENGQEVYAEVPDPPYTQRGWWNDGFRPVMMIYDPMDLARSAKGELAPNMVQPYALIDLSEYMLHEKVDTDSLLLGDIAYDPEHALLYLLELMVDEAKPIVHVFKIGK